MYLKSLTLKGFKSFASSTTLKLEPGICAVVGPNGSGKSNVVDALAWVMGEQGAKTLRGGTMDDVIFAGAGDRKALGRAEVTLTIDNSDGALPIDFTEVSITRRVFRDGGSEYEINGAKARLMDVQELLSDSGIGREMHVIVGQGRLASILESKPEDRRAFIEEAAGVLKHRRRKDKALRKLQAMQGNMDRLQDLATELERQLKPLARQAKAAQRAATVQAEAREARVNLGAHSIITARAEAEAATASASTTENAMDEAHAVVTSLTATRDEIDDNLATLGPQADDAQHMYFRLASIAERLRATERIARDRAASTAASDAAYHGPDADHLEAQAIAAAEHEEELLEAAEEAAERLENIREEVAEAEEAAEAAEKAHRQLVQAIADRREGETRLEAAEQSARARLDAAQADAARAQESLDALVPVVAAAEAEAERCADALAEYERSLPDILARVENTQRERDQAEERLKALRTQERDAERSISALDATIAALTAAQRPSDGSRWLEDHTSIITGRLASYFSIEPGWEAAVAAALGPAADAVVAGTGTSAGTGAGSDGSSEPGFGDGAGAGSGSGGGAAADSGVDGFAIEEAVTALAAANAGRAVIATEGATEPWRLDATLPEGAVWLLDRITPVNPAGGEGASAGSSNPAAGEGASARNTNPAAGEESTAQNTNLASAEKTRTTGKNTAAENPGLIAALTALLVDVVAAPTLATARAIVADDPRLRAVTPEGIVVGHGWIQAGAGAPSAVETQADIEAARRERAAAVDVLRDLEGTLNGAEQAANDARDAQAHAKALKAEFAAEKDRLSSQAAAAQKAKDRAVQERARARADYQAAEARIDGIHTELDDLAHRRSALDEDTTAPEHTDAAQKHRDDTHAALTQVRAMEVEARMALRMAEERAASVRGRAASLRRQAENERNARAAFEQQQQAARDAAARAAHVAALCATAAQRAETMVAVASTRKDGLDARKKQAQTQLSSVRSELSAATHAFEAAQKRAHDAQVRMETARVRVVETEQRVRDQLGIAPEDILAAAQLDGVDIAEERERLASAERALKSLGKVNPLALEEYKALEERYSFLSTQLEDVKQARADLLTVVKEVDATILQLFTDAWNDVRDEFPRVFHTLFPGGEGRLSLTDPEDMLTTGIEVHARPPGKKVTRLSLLSGGEKSLTALALLVSIFRARPSPFYVMDEVEAALDDVNLRRLIALFEELRADSQLIVITHQKPTMDIANVLYGVTMRGDGVTRVISQRMAPHPGAAAE